MLERIASVLTRLRTFELIEGGRGATRNKSSGSSGSSSLSATTPEAVGGVSLVSSPATAVGGTARAREIVSVVGPEAAVDAVEVDGVRISKDDMLAELDNEEESSEGGDDVRKGSNEIHDNEDDDHDEIVIARGHGDTSGCDGRSKSEIGAEYTGAGKEGSDLEGDEEKEGINAQKAEVSRWLRFRTTDLVAYVGAALQVGDLHAASIAWRRHCRTDGGPGRSNVLPSASGLVGDGCSSESDGGTLAITLPEQLAGLPAGAPPQLLGEWLRDEVLPSLNVAGAMAVSPLVSCFVLLESGAEGP